MKKQLNSLQDTKKFAKEFSQMIFDNHGEIKDGRNVILLQGELGAGKTTFSQFLLEVLGAEGPFTSPTFVIMKKYEIKNNLKKNSEARILKDIYHLDCYRVDEESILDLGWEEIVADKNNLILVEWPERIKKIWPEKYWLLKFEQGRDTKSSRQVKMRMI